MWKCDQSEANIMFYLAKKLHEATLTKKPMKHASDRMILIMIYFVLLY